MRVERPDTAINWLARPKVAGLLTALQRDRRPLNHQVLDELPASKTLAHLRSVLVATGALPVRDERLVDLERWIAATIQARSDPTERQILHSYGIWHHLRRLRQRLDGTHTTRLQALNVRCHLIAAIHLLDWLTTHGRALTTCTQTNLDDWAAAGHSRRGETAHFVRWAVAHKHARGLALSTIGWHGPAGPHDTEKRWDDARRHLHDDTLHIADRVAGLLLLLYPQRVSTITQLTTDNIHDDGQTMTMSFGHVPLQLPELVAVLVRELVATRKGSTIIKTTDTDTDSWLFPGRRPGQPLSDHRLGQRLQRIGLHPGQDRSTALFALATELPAAVLARILGIYIKVAVAWQHAASGDWTAYAAERSQRTP